uniref:Uncharacterized protein n=1 Tax=Cacopsylla melanoneura TaxID=428564 RepID=A0A8D8M164_9HEMI
MFFTFRLRNIQSFSFLYSPTVKIRAVMSFQRRLFQPVVDFQCLRTHRGTGGSLCMYLPPSGPIKGTFPFLPINLSLICLSLILWVLSNECIFVEPMFPPVLFS